MRVVALYFAIAELSGLSGISYVGSNVCATCHAAIANRYKETAMGRSMTLPRDSVALSEAPLPFKIFDNETSEYFEVSRQGSRLIQSQYANDREGKHIFRQDWEIAYVIGSGENGVSFIVERDGYLFEAPLSYYNKSHTWGFSPGYERHNYAFTRPILRSVPVATVAVRSLSILMKGATETLPSQSWPSAVRTVMARERCMSPNAAPPYVRPGAWTPASSIPPIYLAGYPTTSA